MSQQADRVAFLQAIQNNPNDDAAALIFADWLEEQGELDRAEFLRLELELANIDWADDRRVALTIKRERWPQVQLDVWRKSDFATLRDEPFHLLSGLEFERGLVRSLDISNLRHPKKLALKTLEHVLEKSAIHELRFLRASAYRELIEALAESPALGRVASLHLLLASHELSDVLLRSPYAESLRSLTCSLSAFQGRRPDEWLDGLPLPNLRSLRIAVDSQDYGRMIQWGWTSNELWPSLLRSRRFDQLTGLNVSGLHLGDKGMRQWVKRSKTRDWERLNLNGNRLTDESARLIANHPAFSGLRELKITDNAITQEGAFALADSPVLSRLVSLEIDRNPIGYNGLLALLSSRRLRSLAKLQVRSVNLRMESASARDSARTDGPPGVCRSLFMDSCLCDATDLRGLTEGPLLANLREWSLGTNPFGDSGIEVLTKSPHFRQLQRLSLRNCRITQAGAETLAQAAPEVMPNLIEADLRFNPASAARDGQRGPSAGFGSKLRI